MDQEDQNDNDSDGPEDERKNFSDLEVAREKIHQPRRYFQGDQDDADVGENHRQRAEYAPGISPPKTSYSKDNQQDIYYHFILYFVLVPGVNGDVTALVPTGVTEK